MDGGSNNLTYLDLLAILSVSLQILGYKNDMNQSTNDDLMKELQRQDREYLQKIVEKQNLILEKLTELG